LGLFGKSLSAEQVKDFIGPSIDLAKKSVEKYQHIDFDSENWLEETKDTVSIVYRYLGTSAHQSFELIELLKDSKISAVAMEAANKTFFMFYSTIEEILEDINMNLRIKGVPYKLAIDFHSECWKRAKEISPTEMKTFEKIQDGKNRWDWINSETWALL
jgi:hypothetical protein